MQNKDGVIALIEVFIDQFLRASHTTNRLFPAHWMEYDANRLGMYGSESFEPTAETPSLLIQSSGRRDESSILRERLRHSALPAQADISPEMTDRLLQAVYTGASCPTNASTAQITHVPLSKT